MKNHRLVITWQSKTEVEAIDPRKHIGTVAHFEYAKTVSDAAENLVQELIDAEVLYSDIEIKLKSEKIP